MMRFRYPFLILSLLIFPLLSVDLSLAASFSTAGMTFDKKVKSIKEIRQKNVVTQSLDFSCGAAGLSTLLNFYLKDPITETQILTDLLKMVPLDKVKARHGFSLFDLKKYAETKGYKVTGYKMDFDFLRQIGKPVLVPIKFKNYRHFVVVKAVIGDRVFIADPAVGNMTMKDTKFKTIWTNGVGFLVEHPDSEVTGEYPMQVAREDVRMQNYQALKSFMDPSRIRTTVFTNEWGH